MIVRTLGHKSEVPTLGEVEETADGPAVTDVGSVKVKRKEIRARRVALPADAL